MSKASRQPARITTGAVNKQIKKQLPSKEAYELTMQEIDTLMKKGEMNLSDKEVKKLQTLSAAAESYEDVHDPLSLPTS